MNDIINLSPFEALRLQDEISQFNLEDNLNQPDFVDVESFEEVWDKIKQFLKMIKNQLVKLLKFIKDKLVRWFKSSVFKRQVNKITSILKTGYLTDREFRNLIIQYFKQKNIGLEETTEEVIKIIKDEGYSDVAVDEYVNQFSQLQGGVGNTWSYLIASDGTFRDINKMMNHVENIITDLLNKDFNYLKTKYKYVEDLKDKIVTDRNYGQNNISFIGDALVKYCLGWYHEDNSQNRLTVDGFIHYIRSLENNYHEITIRITKLIEQINKINDSLINQNNNLENNYEYWDKMVRIQLMRRCCFLPVNYLSYFSRFVSWLTEVSFREEYTTTTTKPFQGNKLYHLSNNPHLPSILKPRYPEKGHGQNLPPRISCSLTVEGCCYGLGLAYFERIINGGWKFMDLYLYDVLIEEGKTKYLKRELAISSLDAGEYLKSQEICIVSPVKITKPIKVRVWYDSSMKQYDDNRYRVEYL